MRALVNATCAAIITASILSWPCVSWAKKAGLPKAVEIALQHIQQGEKQLASGWSYRQLLTTAKGRILFSYNPKRRQGLRWKVLEVNGKPPTKGARRRLSRQARSIGKAGALPIENSKTDWLERSSFRLIEVTKSSLVYRVTPASSAGNSAVKLLLRHLSGRFVVTRNGAWPVSLELSNSSPFYPRFAVRIRNFVFTVTFHRLSKDGPVVVSQTSTEAKGKVFWLKSFDQLTKVRLTDFRHLPASN